MNNNRIYYQSAAPFKFEWGGTGTTSLGINLNEVFTTINGVDFDVRRGNSQLMRISFPSDWVSASLTFVVYDFKSDFDILSNGKVFYGSDNSDSNLITIPNVMPSSSVGLVPAFFNSVEYFQIVSDVAQTNNPEITIIPTALYQVPA